MITLRSLGVGVASMVCAALAVYLCRVDAMRIQLGGMVVIGLAIAGGFALTVRLGRRICRNELERATAVMVFAFGFFGLVVAPISAIAANASYYRWAMNATVSHDMVAMTPYLVAAVEHTLSLHLGGVIVIWGSGFVLARRIMRQEGRPRAKLAMPQGLDMAFGVASWIAGLVVMAGLCSSTDGVFPWVVYSCGAFLLSVLFQTFRSQWRALRDRPRVPPLPQDRIPVRVGVFLGVLPFLCALLTWPVGQLFTNGDWIGFDWIIGFGLADNSLDRCHW